MAGIRQSSGPPSQISRPPSQISASKARERLGALAESSAPPGPGLLGDSNLNVDPSGPHQFQSGRQAPARQVRDPVATFTGRSVEIERLTRMLRSATGAVATVIGSHSSGGIGKTELACRMALETQALFPLQILIDLRGQTEAPLRPELALDRVIRMFPGSELRLPGSGELEPLVNLYRTLLSGQRVLVIADDARDVAQVRPLLPPPGSALLITSRSRLSLQGAANAHLLELDVLPHADSAALLRTVCPRLTTAQAAELSSRVSHLPLALQLLGNVLRDDPTRQYPDFLQQLVVERSRLEALRMSIGKSLDMQAAIAIGWRNVDPWCRNALCQLTVFTGAFDREAAEAVISLPEHASSTAEVLRRLQKGHLLEHDSRTGLFGIHNLVRAFAQTQIDRPTEQPARARHAEYFGRILEESEQRCQRGHEGLLEGLVRFDRDRVHIEAAQAWAAERAIHDDTAAVRCIELSLFGPTLLTQRLPPRVRLRWLESALAAARRLGDRISEGRLLGHIGLSHRDLGQLQQAAEFYVLSLQSARSTGDRGAEARALSSLGMNCLALGQPRQAVAYFEPSLSIARELGDRRAEGVALGNLGMAYLELGQAQQAIAYFELDLASHRSLGDARGEGRALGNLGLAYRLSGQTEKALEFYEQHLKIARLVGDRRGEGNSGWNRALALMALGRRAEAITAAEAALRIREEISDPRAEKVRTALAAWKNPQSAAPA